MTPEQFDALFDSFTVSAFRLEALPHYDVGGEEAERIQAWREGRPIPERSVRTDPWLARIASTTIHAGKDWTRVRVVDEPLTEYQRCELTAYTESQAAGDRTRLVFRSAAGDVGPDFWLFDGDTYSARAVVMEYDELGRWLGAELVEKPALLDALHDARRQLEALAIPLNVFLAGVKL